MTEVPEHLLRRSKDRRSALGLGGGEGGDAASGAAAGSDVESTSSAGAAGTAAQASSTDAPVAAGPPATAAPAGLPAVPAPPKPLAPYVQHAQTRTRIPRWAVPVLAILPFWAIIYAGALTVPEVGISDPVLLEGQELYAANCSGCHGGGGEGGTGRPLGEVILTFPATDGHVAWVVNGSPAEGTPYGDPARPGGQQISQDGWPAMPAFGAALSEEEILAVVRYEREIIGGEEVAETGAEGGEGGEGTADGPVSEAASEGGNVGGEGGDGSSADASPGSGDSQDDEDLAGGSDDEGGPSGGDTGSGEPAAGDEDTAGSGGEGGEGGGDGAGAATGGGNTEAPTPEDAG